MESCKHFFDCCVFNGPPVRYELCNPTKPKYIGIKMVIKEYVRERGGRGGVQWNGERGGGE